MWPLGDQERLQQSRASLSLSDLPLLFSISKTFHKQLEIQRKAVLDGIYLRKKKPTDLPSCTEGELFSPQGAARLQTADLLIFPSSLGAEEKAL